MTFDEACEQLSNWIALSNGNPIRLPSGKERAFERVAQYDASTIAQFEERLGVSLPPSYCHLMQTVGASQLFFGGTETVNGIEIHALDEIESRYADFFDADDLFQRFYPVGCDNRLQELAAFCMKQRSPNNFLVISHEYPPEDWEIIANEKPSSWRILESWIIEAVNSEGDMRVH